MLKAELAKKQYLGFEVGILEFSPL